MMMHDAGPNGAYGMSVPASILNKAGGNSHQDRFGALLLWATFALFIITVCFVNPFREMPLDDDWAYALTVRHLLETGTYRLHDWGAPNMIFQVYWGALFERTLGNGYGSLRVSTLVLAFIGLAAFYALALEHGLTRWMSGLLTMVLLSGHVFLSYSFSFHTDIPFLTCIIVGLLFYTRAIRLESHAWMIAASLAASAAILTRQFGIALVGGICILWMVRGCDRRKIPLYLSGMVLPLISAAWLYHQASLNPNWAMKYSIADQSHYLSSLRLLVGGLVWKPAVIFQYMALYSIPLVLWAVMILPRDLRQNSRTVGSTPSSLEIGLMVAFLTYSVFIMIKMHRLMPIVPYNFLEVQRIGNIVQVPLTVITTIGAALYFRILVRRYRNRRSRTALAPQEIFLDIATLLLLTIHLFFSSFVDKYLLSLVPFTLIVVGKYLQERDFRFHNWAILATVAILVVSAMWTRADLERQEAHWKAGEWLKEAGVPVTRIYGSWPWIGHYRFHEYIAEISGRQTQKLSDVWERWLPALYKDADYVVAAENYRLEEAMASLDRKPPDEDWQVISEIPYRTILFHVGKATIMKKHVHTSSMKTIP